MSAQNVRNQPNKPCPHCGSDDLSVITSVQDGLGSVVCNNCGAAGPEVEAGNELAAWNAREGEGEKVKVVYMFPKGYIF
jgi:Lar family restriction alleviation protein